jgi:limonene-1,2-epoxide hydrolase
MSDLPALVDRFWSTLYRRDWDELAALLAPDVFYEDVSAPDTGAVGRDSVIRRLRIGFDPVESHEHEVHHVATGDGLVMIEHTETWHFDADHTVVLPFVSVMEVDSEGLISRWSDYWNLDTLLGQAPEWWVTHIMEEYERDPFTGPSTP